MPDPGSVRASCPRGLALPRFQLCSRGGRRAGRSTSGALPRARDSRPPALQARHDLDLIVHEREHRIEVTAVEDLIHQQDPIHVLARHPRAQYRLCRPEQKRSRRRDRRDPRSSNPAAWPALLLLRRRSANPARVETRIRARATLGRVRACRPPPTPSRLRARPSDLDRRERLEPHAPDRAGVARLCIALFGTRYAAVRLTRMQRAERRASARRFAFPGGYRTTARSRGALNRSPPVTIVCAPLPGSMRTIPL